MVSQSKIIINSISQQSSNKDDILNNLKSLLNEKSNEFKSIDKELPQKLESLINLTEKADNDKLIKENENYKKQIEEKNKEINDLKIQLQNFSEEKDSIINKDKEEKEKEKENNDDNLNNISKEQTEKGGEEERKKTKKKTKKKKKKKKEENKDEEINEENKEENKEESSKQTEIIEEKKDNKENIENNNKENIVNNNKENIENNNINKEKPEEKEPNYKVEYLKLKNLLNDYEQGNIISQKTKNDIDLLKTESLSKINELRAKIDELNTNNLSKLKEYEALITTANIELSQKNKTIDEYESIALKQEDQIEKLNKHINELNQSIFHKDLSMKQNETYSNQLINIINEHKLKIKKIKEQKKEEENEEIQMLKRENKNLKNELEIDQKIMQNMKINHQNLQDKYLTICYKVKKKEQEDLIKQAQNLSKENINKKNEKNKFKVFSMNRSSSLGMLGIKKFRVAKNKNKVNKIKMKNEEMDLRLPEISYGNKSFENGNINNNGLLFKEKSKIKLDDDYSKNLDDINDKLKKIIDENQKICLYFCFYFFVLIYIYEYIFNINKFLL